MIVMKMNDSDYDNDDRDDNDDYGRDDGYHDNIHL